MRILVTGATGFVGSAVTRRCLAGGHGVHALVRDPEAARFLEQAGARLFRGTIGDPNEVAQAARGCEVVVHAAAVSSHRAERVALEWVNVAGTENVLGAARHEGCRRVVHVSCADVTLANVDRVQWNEERHLEDRPLDHHGRTKQLAEDIVLSACTGSLETAALRPATLWGPGDTTTLPSLCHEGRVRLPGGGDNLVTVTYIDHLVDAIVAALTADAAVGHPFIVADGEMHTAAEFYGALSRAAGLPSPRRGLPYDAAYALGWLRETAGARGPWRTEVVRRGRATYLDHSRVVNQLGCEPSVPFEEGVRRVAEWVTEVGGPAAVAAMARRPAARQDVQAQIDLAHTS